MGGEKMGWDEKRRDESKLVAALIERNERNKLGLQDTELALLARDLVGSNSGDDSNFQVKYRSVRDRKEWKEKNPDKLSMKIPPLLLFLESIPH